MSGLHAIVLDRRVASVTFA